MSSVEDLEDATQRVMVLLQSPERLRALRLSRSPEGYIVTVLLNHLRDIARARSRECRHLGLMASSRPLVVAGNDIEDEEAVKNRAQDILLTLTLEERLLVHLRFWEGLDLAQIARRTGLTYHATAVRMFRLLERLRVRMKGSEDA